VRQTAEASRVDFLIVTPLSEERDAILALLPSYRKLPPSEIDIRTYYLASVPITLPDGAVSQYTIAVVPLAQMGQIDAATATMDALKRWTPRYVILAGIAGGLARNRVSLGDVLVAEQVVQYENAKLTPDGSEIRWRTHEVDQRLLTATKNFMDRGWMTVDPPRPIQGEPKVHFGPICTGDKVIADARVLQEQSTVWPKLIGVEMEGGGVANAVAHAAAGAPGFIMVRGVSDMADARKNSRSVAEWRRHACAIAASFVIGFIRSIPVPVVGLVESTAIDETASKITETLRVQTERVEKWSSKIDVLGMSRPKAMDDVYISLALTDAPRARRIGTDFQRRELTVEEALETSERRMVILGDPGAGKTTTLKKIARRLIAERKAGDPVLPILVILREFRKDDSLIEHLADVASLAVYDRERRELPLTWSSEKTHRSAVRLLSDTLTKVGAFLLIDGLDELDPPARDIVLDEIDLICSSGFKGGVVLTSRSADFTRKPEDFSVFEIEPLQPNQQEKLVSNWFATSENRLRTATEFESAVARVPYKDLRTRPLALVNLCIVFEKYGYLPPSPVTIYRKIVQLLLEEWDSERGVTRYSRYAHFDAARKLDFLAALSYEMDVIRGTRASFSRSNLEQAYREICDRFHLPVDEATIVATEIESHSGLIVRTGVETFEFSHKSLQEYLTAEHICRLRLLPTLGRLLQSYPNELAIAVALASDPAEWFCSLFLVEGTKGRLRRLNTPIAPFLARLALEQPTFGVSKELGFTVLWILSKWPFNDGAIAFCNLQNVDASLAAYVGICEALNQPVGLSLAKKTVFRPRPKATGKFGPFWEITIDSDVSDRLGLDVKGGWRIAGTI
jgi:nucleoside phosphorylase